MKSTGPSSGERKLIGIPFVSKKAAALSLEELKKKIREANHHSDLDQSVYYGELLIAKLKKKLSNCKQPTDLIRQKKELYHNYIALWFLRLMRYSKVKKTDMDAAKLILEESKNDLEYAIDIAPFEGDRHDKTEIIISDLLETITDYKTKFNKNALEMMRIKVILQDLMGFLKESFHDSNLVLVYHLLYEISVSTKAQNEENEILNKLLEILNIEFDNISYLNNVISVTQLMINSFRGENKKTVHQLYIRCLKAALRKRDIREVTRMLQQCFNNLHSLNPNENASSLYDSIYDRIIEDVINAITKNKKQLIGNLIEACQLLKPLPKEMIERLMVVISQVFPMDEKKTQMLQSKISGLSDKQSLVDDSKEKSAIEEPGDENAECPVSANPTDKKIPGAQDKLIDSIAKVPEKMDKQSSQVVSKRLSIKELDKRKQAAQDNKDFKSSELYESQIITQLEEKLKTYRLPNEADLCKSKLCNAYLDRCFTRFLLYIDAKENGVNEATLILENAKYDFEFSVDLSQFFANHNEKTNQLVCQLLELLTTNKTKVLDDKPALVRLRAIAKEVLDFLKERLDDSNLIRTHHLLYEILMSINEQQEANEVFNELLILLNKDSSDIIYLNTVIYVTKTLIDLLGKDEDVERLAFLYIKAVLQKRDISATAQMLQTIIVRKKLHDPSMDETTLYDFLYNGIMENIISKIRAYKQEALEDLIIAFELLEIRPTKIIRQLKLQISKLKLQVAEEKQALLKKVISDLSEKSSQRPQIVSTLMPSNKNELEIKKMPSTEKSDDSKLDVSGNKKSEDKNKKKKKKKNEKNRKELETQKEENIPTVSFDDDIKAFKDNCKAIINTVQHIKLLDVEAKLYQTANTIITTLAKLETSEKEYNSLTERLSKSISEIESRLAQSHDLPESKSRNAISRKKTVYETQRKELKEEFAKLNNVKESLLKYKQTAEKMLSEHIIKKYKSILTEAKIGYQAIKSDFKQTVERRLKSHHINIQETLVWFEQKKTDINLQLKEQCESIVKKLDTCLGDSACPSSLAGLVKSKKEEISRTVSQVEKMIVADIETFSTATVSQLTKAQAALKKEEEENEMKRLEKERLEKELAKQSVIISDISGGINTLNQLITSSVCNPEQLNHQTISNIEMRVTTLVQSIANYESFLQTIEAEFKLSADQAIIQNKEQLKLMKQQQDALQEDLISLKKISTFYENCSQLQRTAQNILALYVSTQAAKIASFEKAFHSNIQDKNITLKKLLDDLAADYNKAKQTLAEAEEQWTLVKASYQKDIRNCHLADPLLLKSWDNRLKTTDDQLKDTALNLDLKQHELKPIQSSLGNLLVEQKKDTALDYLSRLQTELGEKIVLKGGFNIVCGVHHFYSTKIAASVGLKDIDGTISTEKKETYDHLVRQLKEAGFQIRFPNDDPTYTNLVKKVGGVEIDITIAAPGYKGNQMISPLVSGSQVLIISAKEFDLGNYERIEKINDNYIIVIDKKNSSCYEDFKLACQGKLNGFSPYDPKEHSGYCNLVLKSNRKANLINHKKDNHPDVYISVDNSEKSYLSLLKALTRIEEEFILLLDSKDISDQKKPDKEIRKVLNENNGINVETIPFLKVYLRARIRHLNGKYGNFLRDEDMPKIVEEIISASQKPRKEDKGLPVTVEMVKQIADEVFQTKYQSRLQAQPEGYQPQPSFPLGIYLAQGVPYVGPAGHSQTGMYPLHASSLFRSGRVPPQIIPRAPSPQFSDVQPPEGRSPLISHSILQVPTDNSGVAKVEQDTLRRSKPGQSRGLINQSVRKII